MRLVLCNFRCYENATFDLGENGVTLISGASGAGKTTLMMAIDFCLFGAGTKLQMHGKKTCSVELTMCNPENGDVELKVYRQKGPNRLVVNEKYEDDAGEAVVQGYFGKIFSSISYIPQNIRKSFILLTPAEKLEFLETFAFAGVDIGAVKSRAKALVKKYQEEHTKILGGLDVARASIGPEPPLTTLSILGKDQTVENVEKVRENREKRLKNSKILAKRAENTIAQLSQRIRDTSVFVALKNEREQSLATTTDNIHTKTSELGKISQENPTVVKNWKNNLEQLKNQRQYTEIIRDLEAKKTQLEQLKKDELDQIAEQMNACDLVINDEDMSVVRTEIERLTVVLKNQERAREIQAKINLLGEHVDTGSLEGSLRETEENASSCAEKLALVKYARQLETTRVECPKCNAGLYMSNGVLVEIAPNAEKESSQENVETLEKMCSVLRKTLEKTRQTLNNTRASNASLANLHAELAKLKDIGDANTKTELARLKARLCEMENAYSTKSALERKLDSGIFSPTITTLEKSVKKLGEKASSLAPISLDSLAILSEDELSDKIAKADKLADRVNMLETQIRELSISQSVIGRGLETLIREHVQKWGDEKTLDVLAHEKKTLETDLQNFCTESETLLKQLSELETWKSAKGIHDAHVRMCDQLQEMETHERLLRDRYSAACTMRDKILEAESIAITNMITSINTHAAVYLEYFFPDNPINVRMTPFKETKDNASKPQINVEIDYRGMEHDMNMLSGGEQSRVVLAFTLALAEIHNSPLILLDESTASLDQELTGCVVDALRENFNGKLVLLIAHQVVQGAFDTVVKLA